MPTNQRLDGIVVLVVDDDADSRVMLAELLELQGATVLVADNGFTALRVLRGNTPNVLLSDIAMPGMGGLELIEEIRSREKRRKIAEKMDAHLPAAAISALNTPEDRRKSIKAGFHFHIPKPVDFAVLLGIVISLAASSHASSG